MWKKKTVPSHTPERILGQLVWPKHPFTWFTGRGTKTELFGLCNQASRSWILTSDLSKNDKFTKKNNYLVAFYGGQRFFLFFSNWHSNLIKHILESFPRKAKTHHHGSWRTYWLKIWTLKSKCSFCVIWLNLLHCATTVLHGNSYSPETSNRNPANIFYFF